MTDAVSGGAVAGGSDARSRARLRLTVFVVVATFMIAGPIAEQVFGMQSTVIRSWKMFSAIGLGVVDARFGVRQEDGTFLPLDRFEVLGESRTGQIKRIDDRDELARAITRLCGALPPGTDLRVFARRGTRAGWSTVNDGTRNACADG